MDVMFVVEGEVDELAGQIVAELDHQAFASFK